MTETLGGKKPWVSVRACTADGRNAGRQKTVGMWRMRGVTFYHCQPKPIEFVGCFFASHSDDLSHGERAVGPVLGHVSGSFPAAMTRRK